MKTIAIFECPLSIAELVVKKMRGMAAEAIKDGANREMVHDMMWNIERIENDIKEAAEEGESNE